MEDNIDPASSDDTERIRPTKTPMYEAFNAERYHRQALIKEIETLTGNILLCYVAGKAAPISREDSPFIAELLYNVPRGSNVDFMLHTPGGDIDAAEKIVSLLRTSVDTGGRLRIIVPDFAKSAGTLIALAADKILMGDCSELGPIDPQFLKRDLEGNKRSLSVLNYLAAYEEHCATLRANPDDKPAQIMLSKLDPATVVLFQAVKKRAQTLAEEHLKRWMFHNKVGNYTQIASDLMDTNRWPVHGQMVSYEDAQQMQLEVEYLPPESLEWRTFWKLYCHQRLAIRDNSKLFESQFVYLPLEDTA